MKYQKLRLNILFSYLIYYSLMMYFVWSINIDFISAHSSTIYKISNFGLILTFLLSIDLVFKRMNYRFVYPFIIILILILINSYFVAEGQRSRVLARRNISIFSIYLMTFSLLSKEKIKIVFKSLLTLLVIYNILGVLGFIFKFEYFFGFIKNELVDNFRYSSVLKNPNSFGEFTYLSLMISIYLFIDTNNKKTKVVYLLSIFISLLSLVVSMSRNAVLMTVISVIFLIVFNYNNINKQVKRMLAVVFITGLIGIVILSIVNFDFVLNLFRLNQGLNERVDLWLFVLQYIKVRPFVGIGYGNSSLIFLNHLYFQVSHAHNLYLSLLFENGLIPTIVIIGYFVYVIVTLFKFRKLTVRYNNEITIILVVLVSFLAGQIFEFSFLKIDAMNYLIFILLGISMSVFSKIKDEGKYQKKITHLITGLSSGGAEAMLYKLMKYRSSNYRYQVISLTDLGVYGDKIKELGVKVVTIDLNNKLKAIYGIPKLYFSLLGSDVVLTWLYHANFIGTIFGKLAFVKNIIWGIRQSDISQEGNSKSAVMMLKLSKYISFLPTHIISNSEEGTKSHIELGYNESKFITIPNGFEIESYYFDEDNRIKYQKEFNIKDEIVFINVARYHYLKDHEMLLEAIGILKKKYQVNNFKLVLVGTDMDSSNSELEMLINKNGLNKEVILLDERNDVNKILSVADYFLLSSRSEGFPNVIGEAMATSLIPISTDVGDVKQIIGDNGFVTIKENSEEFARTINNVIHLEKAETEELKLNARKRITENYDIVVITGKYEELY